MDEQWQPANDVEHELVAALEAGDSKRFAEIVLSAPLYLPVLPEPGTELRQELDDLISLDRAHVLVFTSPAALSHVLGPFSLGCREVDAAALARNWPHPDYCFALNFDLPIGAMMSPDSLARMAVGEEFLVLAEDAEEVVQAQIRRDCLAELGDGAEPGAVPPTNELEEALAAAVERQDLDAYLAALVDADVVLPLSRPLTDDVDGENFPWLLVGSAIPVFTSTAMISRAAPKVEHFTQLPFLVLAANWPGEQHVLCLNPGSGTELIIGGDAVGEIVAAAGAALSEEDFTS
ncbi:SseB family protein [Saccharopolyspora sp. NPDC050389]|uniref:SseB family protein n=1 Tax=Saccharopolyspora sp. NPDC050389 TaxID=3155516 RepID=UPI0033C115DA